MSKHSAPPAHNSAKTNTAKVKEFTKQEMADVKAREAGEPVKVKKPRVEKTPEQLAIEYRARVDHAKAIRNKAKAAAQASELVTWAAATVETLTEGGKRELDNLTRKAIVKALQNALLHGDKASTGGIRADWADLTVNKPGELEPCRCRGLVKGEQKEGIAKFVCPKAKSGSRGHALVMWDGLEHVGHVYSARIYKDWKVTTTEKA